MKFSLKSLLISICFIGTLLGIMAQLLLDEGARPTSLNSAAQLNPQEFLLRTNDPEGALYLLRAQDLRLTRVSGGPREIPLHDWSLGTGPASDNVVSFYTRAQFADTHNKGELLLFGINGGNLVPTHKFTYLQPSGALAELVWLEAGVFLLAQSPPESSKENAPIRAGIGKVAAQVSGDGEEIEFVNTPLHGKVVSLTRCSDTTALIVARAPVGSYSSLRLSVENRLNAPKLEIARLPEALSNSPLAAGAAPSKNVLLTVMGKSEKTIELLTLWDTTTWQEISSARLGSPIRMGAFAVSPNAKLAAAELASEQAVGVFDTASGKIISTIPVEDRSDRRRGDYEAVAAYMHFLDNDTLLIFQLNGVIKRYKVTYPSREQDTQLTLPGP